MDTQHQNVTIQIQVNSTNETDKEYGCCEGISICHIRHMSRRPILKPPVKFK